MRNLFKLFVGAVALVSVSSVPAYASGRVAADGYNWFKTEQKASDMKVSMVFVDDRFQLLRLLMEKGVNNDKRDGDDRDPKLLAFSTVDFKNKVCTIYAVNPEKTYKPELIGHELMHCFYGKWHD